MSLKGIMSIAGKPGLYKVVAKMASGFIVEGLEDDKRIPVTSTHKISMLDDISIFTEEGDINLKEVLAKIKEGNTDGISVTSKSSSDELKKFFASVLPHYDKDRVYVSDIKKIVNWYALVKDIFDVEDEDEEGEEAPEESTEEKTTEKSEDKN
ncbi:MAG: DUF5606 domain-containing protein [Bacteroidia bacterium]|nr:DUF5606 domain-containing protein [Bacteroidia bacterium]